MDLGEVVHIILKKFSISVLRYENRWVYEYPEEIISDILKFKNISRNVNQ
jgi:hypothetical protein